MIKPFISVFTAILATSVPPIAAATDEGWVDRSDRNAQVLLEVMARFNPEGAGFLGIEGMDEEILQLSTGRDERQIEMLDAAAAELRERLDQEADPRVRLDLQILIDSAEANRRQIRLNNEHLLPYVDVPQIVFQGARALLHEQASPEQHAAVPTRLVRYAGLAEGYSPIFEQATTLLRSSLTKPHLIGPYLGKLERDIATSERYLAGIRDLVTAREISGCGRALDALEAQMIDYNEFLRTQVFPRARRDPRPPPEIYANILESMGVDMPVEELSSRALVAFREIQNEMQVIAKLIAERQGLASEDYRDVVRWLQKKQLVGEHILSTYTSRIDELEAIIEHRAVVTLPQREMSIRLASEAESAAIPSPFMLPPRLIGNTGEMGEFVLPLRVPAEAGGESAKILDYTYDAVSWTLAVHEGRPGHELQFSMMIESGVSLARSIFAFNSANVEGWALYAEAEMKPYLPLEGQLASLQQRLLRAARAFLDPGLQSGEIGEAEALRLLQQEVVLSPALARQDVDRYAFRDPGQATTYFCGYLRLMELRAETERKMGDRFDRREFHDFVLGQGLLPARLMRQVVMDRFIRSSAGPGTTVLAPAD
jgi:hypothetical protein